MRRLAGEAPQAIADALGVERRTVYLWFSDPLVKAEMNARGHDMTSLLLERLADHALAALATLRHTLEMPLDSDTLTAEQKLEVVREILDRCAYTAKVPAAIQTSYVTELPPRDLVPVAPVTKRRPLSSRPQGLRDQQAHQRGK